MDKYKPQLEAMHAEGKLLYEQTETQIKGVLTPQQQEALKVQREKRGLFAHKHKRGHRGMHGDHGTHGDQPKAAE